MESTPPHYHAVAGMLLETIRGALEPEWTDELDETWRDALEAVCRGTIQAATDRSTERRGADTSPDPAPRGCPVAGHSTM